MLQNVIEDEYKSFAVSIYYLGMNLDYAVSTGVAGKLKDSLNFDYKNPTKYGLVLSLLCMIPTALAIPTFYMAGIYSKKQAQEQIRLGKITEAQA